MITGFSHTGLVVRDMDTMVKFYEEAFGFKVVFDTVAGGKEVDNLIDFHVERARIVVLQLGETQIEMLEYRPAGRRYPEDYKSNDLFGMHLAFQTDDMERDYLMLKEKGIRMISQEPQTLPQSHPIFAGTKVLYFQDPEGHPLELIQMPR